MYMGNYLGLCPVYWCVPVGVCSGHSAWGDGVSLLGFALGCPGPGSRGTQVPRAPGSPEGQRDHPQIGDGNDSMTARSAGLTVTCLPLPSVHNGRTATRPLNSNPALSAKKSDKFFKTGECAA